MRQLARRLSLPCLLASVGLAITGCSSNGSAGIFTFGHRDGGNIAASDGLGAALAGQANSSRVAAGRQPSTTVQSASVSDGQ